MALCLQLSLRYLSSVSIVDYFSIHYFIVATILVSLMKFKLSFGRSIQSSGVCVCGGGGGG